MTIYLVSGKLGSGKTLASVGRIRDSIQKGKRIATNLDLNLDELFPAKAGRNGQMNVMRLPDKPTVADLEAVGVGNELLDENQNGLIVLDEMAAYLNAREWANKGRQWVIDWLIHSRKKGWDVIFISQHIDQIDKQIRTALVEYLVTCARMDRLKIPFIGSLVKFLSGGLLTGKMPRVHVGTVRYGTEKNALVAERWIYRGVELYKGYDTRQVFKAAELDDNAHRSKNPPCGLTTLLSPWLTKGRYAAPDVALWPQIFGGLMLAAAALAWVLLAAFPKLRPLYAANR